MIKGIHHINLKVAGADKVKETVSFYHDLLGLELYRSWQGRNGQNYMLKAGEDIIELAGTPTTIGASGSANVRFVTSAGALVVKNGQSTTITYRVGANGEEQTYTYGSADIYAGNDDALWGTDGVKDTFVFDGGNDTIYNYGAEDEIELAGYSLTDLVNNAPAVSGSNVVFDFGGGNTLTVDGKAGSDISFSDGSTFTGDGNKYSKR